PEEVAESVSRIEGSFELALDDPEYRMKRLARQRLCAGTVLEVEETRSRILAVGKAEVDAMAERLFAGRERARFGYGRRSRAAAAALGLAAPKAASAPSQGEPRHA
ncbi:MAG: hypothetical protein JNG85_02425, partial [Spirochaetaceae bacterium]|nr:hypothetical protein [Spirochaetaceae bacterium]